MTEEAVDILASAMERQADALESLAKISQRKGLEDCIDEQTERLTEKLTELVKSRQPVNVEVAAPSVNVAAPAINMPAPTVVMEPSNEKQPIRYTHTVHRDSYGLIQSIETLVIYEQP